MLVALSPSTSLGTLSLSKGRSKGVLCGSTAALALSHQAVSKAATRGEQAAARWEAVWNKLR